MGTAVSDGGKIEACPHRIGCKRQHVCCTQGFCTGWSGSSWQQVAVSQQVLPLAIQMQTQRGLPPEEDHVPCLLPPDSCVLYKRGYTNSTQA